MAVFSIALAYTPIMMIAVALIGALLMMLMFKRFILVRLSRELNKHSFAICSLIVSSLDWPLMLLILCADFVLLVSGIVVAVFVSLLLTGFVSSYASKSKTLKNSEAIVKGVTRIVILCLGLLVLLSILGISVTLVIAPLGISSLAVALALQPTLKNVFSGVQLVIGKRIRR